LTFLVRQILNKTDKVWLKDLNGVCVTKHVIDPILEEIKTMMQNFMKECDKLMQEPDIPLYEFDKINNNRSYCLKVIYEINQKILHHKILMFIARYFEIKGTPQ
jgi:hypothetical protein